MLLKDIGLLGEVVAKISKLEQEIVTIRSQVEGYRVDDALVEMNRRLENMLMEMINLMKIEITPYEEMIVA